MIDFEMFDDEYFQCGRCLDNFNYPASHDSLGDPLCSACVEDIADCKGCKYPHEKIDLYDNGYCHFCLINQENVIQLPLISEEIAG